jgi:hypothetical protein
MDWQHYKFYVPTRITTKKKLMAKNLVILILTVVFSATIGRAQTNDSQTVTNWGKSVRGVELSITLSNVVVTVGKPFALHCQIKNSSTNVVTMNYTGQPIYDFKVSLVSNSGKVYDLTPESKIPRALFLNTFIGINPNETYECNIPLQLGSNVPPGKYKFKVTREISIQKKWYTLVSNLLKEQVE